MKRFGAAIDYSERARHNAIAAAVANIVLHEHRPNFRPHNRSSRTGLETTGFLTMFANIGKKDPAKRVVAISIAVESKISHLFRMRQKFPEKGEALILGKIGCAT